VDGKRGRFQRGEKDPKKEGNVDEEKEGRLEEGRWGTGHPSKEGGLQMWWP